MSGYLLYDCFTGRREEIVEALVCIHPCWKASTGLVETACCMHRNLCAAYRSHWIRKIESNCRLNERVHCQVDYIVLSSSFIFLKLQLQYCFLINVFFFKAQELCIKCGQAWRAATMEGWKLYHNSNSLNEGM